MAPSSFSTLPLELKARIVEMANDQEDMWWERVKDKDPKAEERAGHINSLGALALVNKEFRALAATHQFRQLDGNLAARPIFRFTILPFYGHHITEVTFYVGDSVEGCDNALSAMGQFPALDTLRFEGDQALELFGSFQSPVPSDTVAAYRNRTLDLVAPKIKTLVLYGFDPAEASAVVRRFPNATSLGLSDMEAPGNAGDMTKLFSAVATLPWLSELAIHLSSDFESDWPPEAFAPLGRDPPPIRTLQLVEVPIKEHTFQFINTFASTLKRLTLRPRELVPPLDLGSVAPLRLPHLTHLNLSVDTTHHIKFLRHFTSASTLSYLSLVHPDVGVDSKDPALVSFLDSQPTLRDIHLEWFQVYYPFTPSGLDPEAPASLAAIANLVHSRGIDPSVLDRPHLTPFHPDAKMDYTTVEQPFLSQNLRRTLEFGLVELDRMDGEGNVAKAVGWVEKLRPLEEERLAWKD